MSSDGKGLKTRSGKSYGSAKQDISSRRSHVMNDDVLGLIFNELSVKSLLKVESVCNQFMDCVGSALKRKNGLSIGRYSYDCRNGDISCAIVKRRVNTILVYDVTESVDTFGSILGKCSNITSLCLGLALIDEKIIGLIVTQCRQLKRLHLWITPKITSKCLAAKHFIRGTYSAQMEVKRNIVTNCRQLLPQLSSLESIELNRCTDSLDSVLECLPQSIRRLSLNDCFDNKVNVSVDILKNRCPQLEALSVCDSRGINERNDNKLDYLFEDICTDFALKRLHWECVRTDVFVENIPKLSQLRHLSISTSFNICLDTNAMQSMPSLKSLELKHVRFVPTMMTKLDQILPSVRRLVLTDIIIECECSDGDGEEVFEDNDCPQCVHKCLHLLSQLPQLKRMVFKDGKSLSTIESNDLQLFSGLNAIPIGSDVTAEELALFVTHCLDNMSAKKFVRLGLDSYDYQSLPQRLDDMNVTIPKNFIIKFDNSIYL